MIGVLAATVLALTGAHQPTISGGSRAERALLTQIVDRLQPIGLASIRIAPASRHWRPFPRGGVAVSFTAAGADEWRSDWEAWLVAGIFRDLSARRHLAPVIVYTAGDGSDRIGPIGKQTPNFGNPPPATAARAAELAAQVRAAAAAAGAQVESLDVVAPQGLGFAVTLQVDDPAAFLRHRLEGFFETFNRESTELEGSLIRVEDGSGDRVLETADAIRVGTGGFWVRPDLEGCNPIVHSEPPDYSPPPCPAP